MRNVQYVQPNPDPKHSPALGRYAQVQANLHHPVMLVGLGPHARRIYMHYFKKIGMEPRVIVELPEKEQDVTTYMQEQKHTSDVYFLKEQDRDSEHLSIENKRGLRAMIQRYGISHAIISTEPKAHMAYLDFFLNEGIHVLTDKPLTAPQHVMTDLRQAKKIEGDYHRLMALYNRAQKDGTRLEVQCQRRYHPGYTYIRDFVHQLTQTYQVPLSYMDIYHCDGMWNMPDEYLFRENHPYKYGYGKLYHSGYHFMDLAAWMINGCALSGSKKPHEATLYANAYTPLDHMAGFDKANYSNLLKTNRFDALLSPANHHKFDQMGELDFHGLTQIRNAQGKTLTTCSMNLMQNGFSRRSWDRLPPDTYKSNGRVRHERMNLQIGPLANIQVHSYQAREVKERALDHNGVGSLEHFDIYIFRNTDLIGGEPVTQIHMEDVLTADEYKKGFIGYNEHARERCLMSFLAGETPPASDLSDHKTTVQFMSAAYQSLCLKKKHKNPEITFTL